MGSSPTRTFGVVNIKLRRLLLIPNIEVAVILLKSYLQIFCNETIKILDYNIKIYLTVCKIISV